MDWVRKKVLKSARNCNLTKCEWETFQDQLCAVGVLSKRNSDSSSSSCSENESDHEIVIATSSYYWGINIDLYRACFEYITIDQFHMMLLLRAHRGNCYHRCQRLIERRKSSRKMELWCGTDASDTVKSDTAVFVGVVGSLPFSLEKKRKTLCLRGQKIRLENCTDFASCSLQKTFYALNLSKKEPSKHCDTDIRHVNDTCRKMLYSKIFKTQQIKDNEKMDIFFALANFHYQKVREKTDEPASQKVREKTDEPVLKKARVGASIQKSSNTEGKTIDEKTDENVENSRMNADDEEKVDADDEEKRTDDESASVRNLYSQTDYAMAWAVQWLPSTMILGPTQKFSLKTSKKYASITIVRFWQCVMYTRRWVHAHRPKKVSTRQTFIDFWRCGFAPMNGNGINGKENIFKYKFGLDLQMMLMAKKRRWRRWLRLRYLVAWLMHPDTTKAEFQREINKSWLPELGKVLTEKCRNNGRRGRVSERKKRLLRIATRNDRRRRYRKAILLCKASVKLICSR